MPISFLKLAQTIGLNFMGLSGIESLLWSLLGEISEDQFVDALQKPLILPPEALEIAIPLYRKFPTALDGWTPKYLMNQLKARRSDLWEILMSDENPAALLERKKQEIKVQIETSIS